MTDWALPAEVSDVDLAFPARALELMPSEKECKDGLAVLPDGGRRWLDLQGRWFVHGLPPTVEFRLAPGVDGNKALRHLRVIQGSYAPQHQHKEVAVAYLASLWFVDFAYEGFGDG